jgi:hypothetical protein
MLLLLVYVGRVEKSLAFLPPPMVEGHGGRMMVADTSHLAESDTHIIRLLGLPSPKCLESGILGSPHSPGQTPTAVSYSRLQ